MPFPLEYGMVEMPIRLPLPYLGRDGPRQPVLIPGYPVESPEELLNNKMISLASLPTSGLPLAKILIQSAWGGAWGRLAFSKASQVILQFSQGSGLLSP